MTILFAHGAIDYRARRLENIVGLGMLVIDEIVDHFDFVRDYFAVGLAQFHNSFQVATCHRRSSTDRRAQHEVSGGMEKGIGQHIDELGCKVE